MSLSQFLKFQLFFIFCTYSHFFVLAGYDNIPITYEDIISICSLTSDDDGDKPLYLLENIRSRWSHNLLRLSESPKTTKIAIARRDRGQNGEMIFYIPHHIDGFRETLYSISPALNHDVNEGYKNLEHMLHFICLPSLILKDNATELNFVDEQLSRLHVSLNEEVFVFEEDLLRNETEHGESIRHWKLWEVYSVGDSTVKQPVETFCPSDSNGAIIIDTTELLRYSYRQQNLSRQTITLVGQHDESYESAFHMEVHQGPAVFRNGEELKLVLDFQRLLNFNFEPIPGNGWPMRIIRNGTRLNGFGEQIMDGEADLSVVAISWTPTRAEKLHFLPPIGYSENAIFYLRKTALMPAKGMLLLPFSEEFWLTTLATFAASILVMLAMVRMDRRTRDADADDCRCCSPSAVHFTSILGLLVCQGGNLSSNRTSLRLALLTVAMASSLLYMAYSGSLVSAVAIPLTPFTSYEDLVSHRFTVFTDPRFPSSTEDFVKNKAERERILKVSSETFSSSTDTVMSVLDKEHKFALIHRKDLFYGAALTQNIPNKKLCDVTSILPKHQSRIPESLVMRKGSPLREPFTQKTVLLMERGFIQLYRRRTNRKIQPPCLKKSMAGVNVIDVTECMFAFGVLASGLLLSVISLLNERYPLWDKKLNSAAQNAVCELTRNEVQYCQVKQVGNFILN